MIQRYYQITCDACGAGYREPMSKLETERSYADTGGVVCAVDGKKHLVGNNYHFCGNQCFAKYMEMRTKEVSDE